MVARWDPIGGGSLLGYHVHLRDTYSSHTRQTLRTNKTSIVVKDLKDWLRYELIAQGYTANDTGQTSNHYFYMCKCIFKQKRYISKLAP